MSADRQAVARGVRELVLDRLAEAHSGLKPSVARRAAQRIGLRILGSWLTAWDPLHLGGLRASVSAERALRARLAPLVDLAVQELFHGHVVSLQRALQLVDESSGAALGRCVCRAAAVVNDAEGPGRAPVGRLAERQEHHAGALGVAWASLSAAERGPDALAPGLDAALAALSTDGERAAAQRLDRFWEQTYPYWEVLLVHDSVTPGWLANMRRHGKAWSVPKAVLRPFLAAHWELRGAIFTEMEVLDAPYALCICPGPERQGGCSLVNWYYEGGLDGALHPNSDQGPGQRRDADGQVLPCSRFPERAGRPCLGCGCEHAVEDA